MTTQTTTLAAAATALRIMASRAGDHTTEAELHRQANEVELELRAAQNPGQARPGRCVAQCRPRDGRE